MASWQKIIVSGSSAELNSVGLVTSMSVGANQTIATTQAGTKLSGSFTGSFAGDGSGITGIASTLSITGSTSGTDVVNLKTDGLTFSGANNVTATVTNNTVTIGVTGLVSQSSQIDVRNTTGIATIATTGSNTFVGDQIISGSLTTTADTMNFNGAMTVSGSLNITGSVNNVNGGFTGSFTGDGSGLTGVPTSLSIAGSTSGTDTVNLKTDTLTFTGGNNITSTVTNNTVTIGVTGLVSQSSQIDVRNTTGIATIATTGSNTFTGVQTISNTTNSTNFTDGALVVAGGVGIAKDVNISGSLTVTGLLTAVSSSIQYVTSSQITVGTSRVLVNSNDVVRFGGLSVIDSGSTFGTGSLLWDSLNNRWIYQADDQNYNSAVIIAGPKNTGNLGDEVGLTAGRIPVAVGDDHIDTNVASSSIYIDFATKKTFIEAGLYVTGAITASAYAGDGSGLTGVVATSVEYANVLNKPTLVSASSQIDHNTTTNYVANQHVDHSTVSISAGSGLTGGGNITATRTLSLDTGSSTFLDGVKTKLNTENVVSSSGQIITVLNTQNVVSSSAQITAVLNTANVHSGSYLGTATTTNLPEGTNQYYTDQKVKDKLNTENVVSSSAQTLAHINGQTITPATITTTGDVTIGGDLTVNGTTTTINTTNVLIEDRYILLNSGSVPGGNEQGGIIVQVGANPSGSAMTYSTLNSANRWGVAENVAATATTATQTAYVATVTDMNVTAQASAVATYQKPGNIKVETNGDIYIWA